MSKDKGIKPATTKNVEIKLDILKSEELQSELRTLKEVFEASYGPTGRINLIQHVTGGHVTVTTNSSQILKNITTVSMPLTRLLLQAIQGHVNQFNDGGLFTALLTLQLIESSLKSGLPRHTAIAINELALSIVLEQLNSSELSMKLPADLGNMEQMLCIIRSILATKPSTGMTINELQSLAVLLLRGFLNCTPTSETHTVSLDNLRIHACEGPSFGESFLKKGILLETKCHPVTESTFDESKNVIKVALFDCSLAGNVEDRWLDGATTEISNNFLTIEENALTSMVATVDNLVENGVKLIACQKVIHPTLQRHMTRNGLHVIERLSICHIQAVQKLTGARLLSSFQGKIQDGFGSLADITSLVIHKKRYVHLIPCSNSHPEISTLILCAPDQHSLDELQLLCSAALRALKEVVYHPFVVPGAGCFETNIAGLLMEIAKNCDGLQQLHCSKQQCSKGLHCVALAFLHIARKLDHDGKDQLVHKNTFHHWLTHQQPTDITSPQHCLCGLVTSDYDTEWYMTEELCGTPRDICVQRESFGSEDVKDFKHAVLDVMSMKVNGIRTAFEIANTILRVKHFVKETFE